MCHIAAALAHTRRKANAKLQCQDELPMHCTLLIPDLLPPSDLGAGPFADLRVPNIGTLLARGETARRPPLASEDWLCEQFGVATLPDRPLAALMLRADGGAPQHYYWLCAEPVRLRVDRNRLIVAARVANYTAAEASELVAALNRHFNADGIEFVAPTASRWYARTARAPALATTPLTQALNRSSKHHLPQGPDALAWHGVMNEAQMILHTQPVNIEREALGKIAANSIWLWGGGTLPTIARPTYTTAWGGGPVLHALALAAGVAHRDLPASSAKLLAAADEHSLVALDAPADALRDGDLAAWHERVSAIDREWVHPLLDALRAKTLEQLNLVACNHDNLLETTVMRANLARFWRRPRLLASYAGQG